MVLSDSIRTDLRVQSMCEQTQLEGKSDLVCNSMRYLYEETLAMEAKLLIMNVQACVLKYIFQIHIGLEQQAITIVDKPGGPLSWYKQMLRDHPKVGIAYYSVLSKHLLRLASRLDPAEHLHSHVRIIEIALENTAPEWRLFGEAICRILPVADSPEKFLLVQSISQHFLKKYSQADCATSQDISETLHLFLSRTARQSSRRGSLKQVTEIEPCMGLQSRIDRAMQLIAASSAESVLEVITQQADDLRHNLTEHATTSDFEVLLCSIDKLRLTVVKLITKDSQCAVPVAEILQMLLQSLSDIPVATSKSATTIHKSVLQKLIESWLSVVQAKHNQTLSSDRIREFQLCLEMNERYQLNCVYLPIAIYNCGGILYTRQEFALAAEMLDMFFSIENQSPHEYKKLEYLWSAYLQSGNKEKAYHWLSYCLPLFVRSREEAQLSTDLGNPKSDFRRVVQKLTNLTIDLPYILFPRLDEFSSLLKCLTLEMHISLLEKMQPSSRVSELCANATAILLQIYTQDKCAIDRLRILAISANVFQLCDDFERLDQHLELTRSYRNWFPQKNLLGIAALYETLYLLHNLCRNDETTEELAVIVESVRMQLGTINVADDQFTSMTFRLLWTLLRTARTKGLSLDFLKTSQLLVDFSNMLTNRDSIALLKLELDMVDEYLACGYDSQASLSLDRASKLLPSAQRDSLLRGRFFHLQIRYLITSHHEDEVPARMVLLEKCIEETTGTQSADAHYLGVSSLSLYAENKGNFSAAIELELEALSVVRRKLSKQAQRLSKITDVDAIVSAMDILSLTSPTSASRNMIYSMLHLAQLYESSGAIKDALYYYTEVQTLAHELKDQFLIKTSDTLLLLLQFRANRLKNHNLEPRLDISATQNPILRSIEGVIIAEYALKIDRNEAIQLLETNAESIRSSADVASVFRGIIKRGRSSASDSDRKVASKKSSKLKAKPPCSTILLYAQLIKNLCLLYDLYRAKNDRANAERCILELGNVRNKIASSDDADLTLALSALHNAESLLDSDPVYGVLHDSALSLPSVCSKLTLPAPRPPSKRTRKNLECKTSSSQSTTDEVRRLLQESKTTLTADFKACLLSGSSYSANHRSTFYGHLSLLQTALVDPTTEQPLKALTSNYLMEVSRALPLLREQERQAKKLPSLGSHSRLAILELLTERQLTTQTEFQNDHINTLPGNWSVISIGLTPERTDLIMSRMQAHRSPLILRLPMSRHNSRDVGEDTFDYEQAINELHEIIRLSDTSAQEAKNIKGSQAKTEWWTTRQDLDGRLQNLLVNIEHCWLGGFKGVLNNSILDTVAFDNFRSSFAKIIFKYVPLRQNRSIDLDARILHLFTDLGQVDDDESLELMEDLLYFVLDIYQFHGESIAYDEIDIDQMVVEVQTALETYFRSAIQDCSDQHLVLILDKSLHMFPWESLPCLSKKSVSRVPSIAILRSLLEQQQEPSRIVVERAKGHFVLNPGGDLRTTETTFSKTLSDLPGWSGVVAKRPLENEIVSFLESGSVYMYFGHGAGEQYVRPTKIKSLPRCAVTILMGCSSGALKDQGIYDPWGTPYNYMVAKW